MSSGSAPSGGVDEKNALVKSIQDSNLDPTTKQTYLDKANAIQVNNIVRTNGGLETYSQSLNDVNDLNSQFQQAASDRQTTLLKQRAQTNATLYQLQQTPGSTQTTNLAALAPNTARGAGIPPVPSALSIPSLTGG